MLKIGDKVKIIGWPGSPMIGKLGEIFDICPIDSEFEYMVRVGKDWACAMHGIEIEKVLDIGQMLFSFMAEGF